MDVVSSPCRLFHPPDTEEHTMTRITELTITGLCTIVYVCCVYTALGLALRILS
jgi:hypothetical protein